MRVEDARANLSHQVIDQPCDDPHIGVRLRGSPQADEVLPRTQVHRDSDLSEEAVGENRACDLRSGTLADQIKVGVLSDFAGYAPRLEHLGSLQA